MPRSIPTMRSFAICEWPYCSSPEALTRTPTAILSIVIPDVANALENRYPAEAVPALRSRTSSTSRNRLRMIRAAIQHIDHLVANRVRSLPAHSRRVAAVDHASHSFHAARSSSIRPSCLACKLLLGVCAAPARDSDRLRPSSCSCAALPAACSARKLLPADREEPPASSLPGAPRLFRGRLATALPVCTPCRRSRYSVRVIGSFSVR